MTFLQPALLAALPLAAIPIIIHLIHLYRRRQVKWAAMMFLRQAQKMNKGLSRLRQVLILAFRVLAVAAIIFVVTRPLSGGWLGLTGGAPDTVLVLLDRSASMEQQNLATGVSKREAGLRNIAKAINDAVGTRSRLVLIDSATLQAQTMQKADALLDLPSAESTETEADIPGLLQAALDYITTNKSGRTDVWVLSDLQQSDWDASGGRWETLRTAFGALQGVRFHLLAYPQLPKEDLAVRVERVVRRETAEKAELLMDFRITRQADVPEPVEVPVRMVVNGVATTMNVSMKESQVAVQGHAIPIDKASKRGSGRVELPADASMVNNVFYFVFDEPAAMRSVIVSDDQSLAGPLKAALSAAADPSRQYIATVLPAARAAEIAWDETALIVWQAPLPLADDVLAKQLVNHAAAGRSILFLPPETPTDSALFGLHWGVWSGEGGGAVQTVEWWRNDADLLSNTRDNSALPVGSLEILRRCAILGEGVPLARVTGQQPLLMRSSVPNAGNTYFLGTLPGPSASSMARDGVVMFAALHRALHAGARTLGKAQQRDAGSGALGAAVADWRPADEGRSGVTSVNLPLRAGVVASEQKIVALNRPAGEDRLEALSPTTVNELFAGLDFRLLTDSLDDGRSLTNEIWRTFLVLMALAIVGEALLCMPGRREIPRPGSPRPQQPPPVRREPEPAELVA